MDLFVVYRFTRSFAEQAQHDRDLSELITRKWGFKSIDEAAKLNQQLIEDGHLIPAAVVNCDLINLFTYTNSITSAWAENDNVRILNVDAFFSSSTKGDVFVDVATGQWYIYKSMSIEPLYTEDKNPPLPKCVTTSIGAHEGTASYNMHPH